MACMTKISRRAVQEQIRKYEDLILNREKKSGSETKEKLMRQDEIMEN